MKLTRRAVLPLILAAPLAAKSRPRRANPFAGMPAIAAATEAASGGRLGMALLDLESGVRYRHRAGDRFPMCSTFKMPLIAQLLMAVDQGRLSLTDTLPIAATDMVDHAPFTQPRIGQSATLEALAAAIMIESDNPATNIVLRRLGGPAAHTQWLRSQGDRLTRLDRWEPDMSDGLPDDPRDTTSPTASLATARHLLFGSALSPASRTQLFAWMSKSETGDTMLRAGLPAGWSEANKTGSGSRGIRNIVSVITPPPAMGRKPILAAIFLAGAEADPAARNAHYPPIARAIAAALAI